MGKYFDSLADQNDCSTVEEVFGINQKPKDSIRVEMMKNYIESIIDSSTVSGRRWEEYDELLDKLEEVKYNAERVLGLVDETDDYIGELDVWGKNWKVIAENVLSADANA